MHIWATDPPKHKFLMDKLPQYEAARMARTSSQWLKQLEKDFLTKFPITAENTGNEAVEVLRTKKVRLSVAYLPY